ncbi:MFS transporter [Galactobacter sp.]|uniref:MFS transporter n=1 Tax=Galactobacter sp. TaxID=2676125 RepID=UPI0025C5DFED|nr:MFS transporter [Galactobacter sp.]
MSRMFASLSEPNYRLWFLGGLVSNTGAWMQRTAQDWLVLTELTNHSGTATGIVTGLQFLPMLFLSPYAGLVADRMDKLKLLKITQALSGIIALALGLLVLTGTAELWHVYALAFALGVVTSFDNPPRQALVNELVAHPMVPNAVSLNSTSFNAARLIGPGLSGLLIAAVGTGWMFVLNAASYVAVIGALMAMKRERFYGGTVKVERHKGQLREGLSYVLHDRTLVMVFVLAFVVGTFGMNFPVYNAVMTASVFHAEADAYGIVGTIMAVGTLGGALAAAGRQGSRVKWAVGGAALFGVFGAVAAWMPGFWWFALMLIPTGFASITFLNSANVTVQMSVAPQYRGRVMALYIMVVQGGTPIGSPIMGWVAEVFGGRWALTIGTGVCTIAALWALVFWSREHRGVVGDRWKTYTTRARERVRWRPRNAD